MSNKWLNLTDKERAWILESGSAPSSLVKKIKSVDKRISIASAKAKGRNLQKWVCDRISKMTGIPYDQQDDECLIHSREMGQAGTDVIVRGEAAEKFPYSVECKSTETFKLIPTINQARDNIVKERPWLIVFKAKALSTPVAIMDWETFEGLQK